MKIGSRGDAERKRRFGETGGCGKVVISLSPRLRVSSKSVFFPFGREFVKIPSLLLILSIVMIRVDKVVKLVVLDE